MSNTASNPEAKSPKLPPLLKGIRVLDIAHQYSGANAAAILADLGIASVRLMTNNPRKVELLRGLGVAVVGRYNFLGMRGRSGKSVAPRADDARRGSRPDERVKSPSSDSEKLRPVIKDCSPNPPRCHAAANAPGFFQYDHPPACSHQFTCRHQAGNPSA